MINGVDSVYTRIRAINERIKEINDKVGNIYSSLNVSMVLKTYSYNLNPSTNSKDQSNTKTFQEILQEAFYENEKNEISKENTVSKLGETYQDIISKSKQSSKEVEESKYDEIIRKAELMFNVPKELIKAVIKAESNFNPIAISPKNAMGLMQLLPSTAKEMGVEDIFDPFQNIMGGVKYLRTLLDKYNGNLFLALSAYNAGPSRVDKINGIPEIEETQNYVDRVIKFYKEYSK
ncbi:MAG: lytic transglycosylase domain-containing protein [Brevinematia bacterium]